MKVRVDALRDKPFLYCENEVVDSYPELAELQASGEVSFLSPLSVSLKVQREYDHIRAEGSCDILVSVTCSRCLAGFEQQLHTEFTLFFSPGSDVATDEEEVELADHDLVSISYAGDEIDFAPYVSEQVIMELPYKPLCGQDCKGLCTVCGANLNSTECGCDHRPASLTFGALKDFRVKNKGE